MSYPEKVERVLTTLRRVIRGLDSHSRQISQHRGLTVPQILIMREMNRRGSISVGDLAREVSLSQATITSILDRLEHRNLVQRSRGQQDKRTVWVELTADGRTVLDTAPPLLQEKFVKSFGELKDWEQSQILASLERIADMMGIAEENAAPVLMTGPIAPQPADASQSKTVVPSQ